jgi:hypothetical protein
VLRALLARLNPYGYSRLDTVRAFLIGALGFKRTVVNPPFAGDSREVPTLAAAFLDTEHCAGARGLSEDEIAELKAIRDSTRPPASKQ